MFDKSNYLIKEHVAFLKLVDKYDIIDVETGSIVAYAKENISGWMKFFRLLINKSLLSTRIEIRSSADETLLYSMEKGPSFFRSKVFIKNKDEQGIGYFQSRVFTLKGRFDVFGSEGSKVAEVKGNWTGWNFKFLDISGSEIGEVTKKWSGLGKELFTSADNYVISVNPALKGNKEMMALLIMAGLSIDIVYKEKK